MTGVVPDGGDDERAVVLDDERRRRGDVARAEGGDPGLGRVAGRGSGGHDRWRDEQLELITASPGSFVVNRGGGPTGPANGHLPAGDPVDPDDVDPAGP